MVPKWTEAFIDVIKQVTGETKYTYVTAVTVLRGDRSLWEDHERFRRALGGNPLKLLTMMEILAEVLPRLSTTVASSSLARTLQLLKASAYLRPV